jgi:hypothetical protein
VTAPAGDLEHGVSRCCCRCLSLLRVRGDALLCSRHGVVSRWGVVHEGRLVALASRKCVTLRTSYFSGLRHLLGAGVR